MTTTIVRQLSLLVHAHAKVGKTTLAATAPLPIIVFDAEGGWKFIPRSPFLAQIYGRPLVVTMWDPYRGPPPQYDGAWDICVVPVSQWGTAMLAYDYLKTGQHQFKSLVVDSISELQRRCKANIAGAEDMKMQYWGKLLTEMDRVIRGLRDLTIDPWNPIEVAVFIAETRQHPSGKFKPYMQGQIETALPYWLDVVGYLDATPALDANGQPTQDRFTRTLLVSPHPLYEAGERVQGVLGGVVHEPTIYGMLHTIYGQ